MKTVMKWMMTLVYGVVFMRLMTGEAMAVNRYWVSAQDGDFQEPTNWNPAGIPGDADRAYFELDGEYTVTFLGSVTNDWGRFNAVNGADVKVDIGAGQDWYFDEGWRESLNVSDTAGRTNSVVLMNGSVGGGGRRVANGADSVATLVYSNVTDELTGTGNLNVAAGLNSKGEVRLVGGSSMIVGSVIDVGIGSGATGTLYISDSVLTHHLNNINFGKNSGHGIMTLTNNAVCDFTGKWLLMGWSGSSAELNMHGGTINALGLQIPFQAGSTASFNMSDGEIILDNDLRLGDGGGIGSMLMSGGTINVTNSNFYIGKNAAAEIDCHLAGGEIKANALVVNTLCSLKISGGLLDTIDAIRNDFKPTGKVTIVGTNGVFNIGGYFVPAVGSETCFLFQNGGVSPIEIGGSTAYDADLRFAGETLTLGFNGYLSAVTTNPVSLITAEKNPAYRDDFDTKNLSIFQTGTVDDDYAAWLDVADKVAEGPLVLGSTVDVTDTNAGWIDVNNAGMSGVVDILVKLNFSTATKTQADLLDDMLAAGLEVSEVQKNGSSWIKIVSPAPTFASPAYAWDLSTFDSAVKVDALAIEKHVEFPLAGTVILVQ